MSNGKYQSRQLAGSKTIQKLPESPKRNVSADQMLQAQKKNLHVKNKLVTLLSFFFRVDGETRFYLSLPRNYNKCILESGSYEEAIEMGFFLYKNS